MRQDEVLFKIADRVKNFAAVYLCDLDQVWYHSLLIKESHRH